MSAWLVQDVAFACFVVASDQPRKTARYREAADGNLAVYN
jgi:hypothetical protein